MSKVVISARFEEDPSDVLSTSAPNSNIDDSSPTHDHDEGMDEKSKKIRKKRNAYQKIDDDIRVKLLEAVQQHGETLKSAAKRFGINYSSAKSILHTYRKEGRILKKSGQERTLKRRPDSLAMENMPQTFSQLPPQNLIHSQSMPPLNNQRNNFKQNLRVNTSKMGMLSEGEKSIGDFPSPSSPMNKLTDNFVNLLQFNQNGMAVNQAGYIQNLSRFHSGPAIQTSPYSQLHQCGDTFEMLKMMDNFYMNYSNSPLSSERIVRDGSAKSTGTNRLTKEFDSFSDMINALQHKSSEEFREEIHIPKPLRLSAAQKLQEHIESKTGNSENVGWKGTIEDAALDTFKTVVDAQLLLCDALKKANFLNNLVHVQKTNDQGSQNPE